METRREFITELALTAGGIVLVPAVTSCSKEITEPPSNAEQAAIPSAQPLATSSRAVPRIAPADWDAVAFNKARGNEGAIPKSYHASINGPDGDTQHLGKHLPYVTSLPKDKVPKSFVPLMWGDPKKGYAKHPNAIKGPDNNNEGHWYNWIRIAKAVEQEREELQSSFTDWPGTKPGDNGSYAVFGGGDITADSGRNTIYLCALPKDVKQGDTIRVWSHCLTHGEYVDFITLA